MLAQKKAVIFDLDGTLVDSMWVWEEIDIRFLKGYGITAPEGLGDQLNGLSFHQVAVCFKDMFSIPLSIEEIKDTWNQMAMEAYTKEIFLKEGAYEFITALREKDYMIGLASSNSRPLVERCIHVNKIEDFFDTICTSDEVQNGKPEPDIYLKVADDLKVKPKDVLVFEDIPFGLTAAKRANMDVCTIQDDYSDPVMDEKRKLADYYVNNYFDVLNGTYETLT